MWRVNNNRYFMKNKKLTKTLQSLSKHESINYIKAYRFGAYPVIYPVHFKT